MEAIGNSFSLGGWLAYITRSSWSFQKQRGGNSDFQLYIKKKKKKNKQ